MKAFIRGESLPFSAGELEGIACLVNMHVRVAKRLQSNSLRYWLLEYLRRQERERKFSAMILRLIKDRTAALLLMEVSLCFYSVGLPVSLTIGSSTHIRSEFFAAFAFEYIRKTVPLISSGPV